MFSHSLFALPFGLMGMLIAANGLPAWRVCGWVVVALVGARNAANALNRLIDAQIDAHNPRTAGRHLPQGKVSGVEVLGISIIGMALLCYAAWQLNPLCLALSPLAVFIMVVYSYTKRFTWACHLVLGFTCGIAPTAAWLAVTGHFALPPLILTTAVMCWVAGFDIIYATQDADLDREQGLYSIPGCFGVEKALTVAKLLHLAVVILLFLLPALLRPPYAVLGWPYYLGMVIVTLLLIWEHLLVKPDDLKKVTMAAYYVNQVIGATLLLFTYLNIFVWTRNIF
jgi:4-hydroxybenzoate polyprenyltransferase